MDILEYVLFGLIGLLVIAIIGVGCDYFLGTEQIRSGVIIEKSYTPSSTSTGVGPSIGGNGGVAVVVSSSPAKYILFIKTNDGDIDEEDVDRNRWLSAKVGNKINYTVTIGKFTGAIY